MLGPYVNFFPGINKTDRIKPYFKGWPAKSRTRPLITHEQLLNAKTRPDWLACCGGESRNQSKASQWLRRRRGERVPNPGWRSFARAFWIYREPSKQPEIYRANFNWTAPRNNLFRNWMHSIHLPFRTFKQRRCSQVSCGRSKIDTQLWNCTDAGADTKIIGVYLNCSPVYGDKL